MNIGLQSIVNPTCILKSVKVLLIFLITLSLGNTDLFGQNYGILKKIFDPDGAADDTYGWSVGVSDSVAIVGAPNDGPGSAHVYFRNQGGTNNWGFVARLEGPGMEVGDEFGYSVAVSDTVVVVGVPFEDVPGSNSGAAYVFTKNTGGPDNWGLLTELLPSGTGSQDEFGRAVTISGPYIAVGAPENTQGTVHIFYRDQGGANNWGELAVLTGAASGDEFGGSLDLKDTTLVVGAPGDDVGGQSDMGSASVYYRDNDNWTLIQTFSPSDGTQGDRFGTSVSLDSVTVVVGSPFDDDDGDDSGSAYLFRRDQGGPDNWGELPIKLVGSSTAAGDQFGFAVSMSRDVILVGAPQDDDSGASSGVAFIFRQDQGGPDNWGETQRLQAFDAVSGDQFGYAVDVEGPFLYIGAPFDDDSGINSGSVYIYREDEVICPEAPTLDCQDVTLYLDEAGVAELLPDDINSGSFASCEFNVTLSQSIFSCDDIGENQVTLTLIDLIGNQAECTANVTVVDTIGPVFVNCPADTLTVSNNAGACQGNIIWSIPVAQDNCTIDSIVQISGPEPGTAIPLGTYDIQYVAYDGQLLTDTCSFVLVIVDTEAPFLACLPDLQFDADEGDCDWTSSVGQLDPLIAIDNCEPVLGYEITTSTGVMSADSGAVGVFDFPVGVNTICYMLTDSSGSDMDTCCFTITVFDTQEPMIDCSEDIVVGTDMGVCEAEVSWTIPTPTDNCEVAELEQTIFFSDGTASNTIIDPDDYGTMTMDIFTEGVNTVLYVVTDTSGNMNACMFEVTVIDVEAPMLVCPEDITINTSDGGEGDCAGNLTFTHPTPTDNCGVESFTIQILNPNGSVEGPYEVTGGAMQNRDFDLGTSIISYIAVDTTGNSTVCSYSVVVVDDEDPEFLTCPPDTLTIGTDVDLCGAFVYWAVPIAGDNCGVELVDQISGPMPGDSLAPGFYTVVYVAYDAASPPNTDTCEFVINVIDTQAPLLLCPSNNVVVGTDPGNCTWLPPLGTLTPSVAIGNCPYEITWEVYKADTLQGSGFDDVSGNHTFDLDTSYVCYYITETEDLDGNGILMDTCCFLVIVQDNEEPMITCPPNVTFLDDEDGAEDCQHTVDDMSLDANATDNCTVVSLTHDYPNMDNTTLEGAVFPVGVTIVTWTAVDTAGNIETCLFTVTVLDNIDPFIACPESVEITTSNNGSTGDCFGEFDWTHPTPTDNCAVTQYNYTITNADGTQSGPFDLVPLLNPNAPGSLFDASYDFQLGVSTVQYFAADAAGNTFDCSFDVAVTDDEDPEFVNCPAADTLTIGTDVDNCSAFVNWSIPIAEDNCEVTVTQIGGPMPGDELAPGFYTIIYLAEDAAMPPNTDTCEFVINVVDTQEPLILCPSNDVVVSSDPGQCTWLPPAGSLSPTIAIANCPFEVTWEVYKNDTLQGSGFDDVSGNHVFNLDTSYVCYYIIETEDPDGNGFLTDTCCFMVIVQDNEEPMITCPMNVTFEDTDDGAEDCQHTVDDMSLDADATDNCSVVSLTHNYPNADNTTLEGAVFPVGITVVTWTAVDTAGNIETCSFVVTVEDNVLPVVICPEDVEIGTSNNGSTGDCLAEYDWTHPLPTDNCYVIQYNYLIYNGDGTVSGPFDLVPLLDPNAPPELFDASYNFPLGTNIVEYYVADSTGNSDTCTFTVFVVDDENPEFLNCPLDTLEFGNEVDLCGAFADYPIPIATDNCEVEVFQVAGPGPGEFLAPGFYTVIWVALDPSGNSDTCEFVLRIIDTQIPAIDCPSNDVVVNADDGECSWSSPDGSLSPINAFDNCDYTITWTKTNPDGSVDMGLDDVSGEVFELDTTVVCYIITENEDPDLNGIQADTCCFLVIVEDTELPMITCPEDVAFDDTDDGEEDCAHTVAGTDLDATATDNCAVVSLTHNYAGGGTTLDGATFPVGMTTVTWTATDTSGNIATCSFVVTVNDNIDPMITCPPDTTIPTSVGQGLDCFGQLVWLHPVPTDNCNITEYTVTYTNPDNTMEGPFDLLNPPQTMGDRLFAVGVSTVTYFVEDSTGNTNGCSFTVTVEDTEDPIFVNCPDTLTFGNDPSECGAFVNWPEPIAVDNCNDTLPVIQIAGPPSGSFIPVGVFTEITYQATDDDGNTALCVFIVVVEDNENPNAVCQDTVVYLDELGMVTITADDVDGGSYDNCAIDTAIVSITQFTCDDVGENNVMLTVFDEYGNADICFAEVTVIDTIPPDFECPMDTMISVCERYVPDFVTGLTGTDNCTDVTFMQNPLAGVEFFVPVGDTFEVIITATDAFGNSSTCIVNLIIFDDVCNPDCADDTEPPMWLNCPPPPIKTKAMPGMCGAFVNFQPPIAIDNCELDTIIQIDNTGLMTGDMFPAGLTILKWIAIDVEGNISDTCRLKIFVNDQQPPQLLCPADTFEVTKPGTCVGNVFDVSPIALDNCFAAVTFVVTGPGGDITNAGADDVSGENFGCGQFEVTYKVTDQNILLISEVTHELEALNGGTNPVPGFIQTTDGDDFLEITNYGPATMNISCLTIERMGGNNEVFVVPDDVILGVGQVFTLHYGGGTDFPGNHFYNIPGAADLAQSDPAGYVISIDTLAIDVLAVNGFDPVGQANESNINPSDWSGSIDMSDGGSAYRKWAYDSNSEQDYAVANLCMPASIGTLNPGTDLLAGNGMNASLQSLPPNMATCSFMVMIEDFQLPECGELATMLYEGTGGVVGPASLVNFTIDVPDDVPVYDVNILDLVGSHPNMGNVTIKLTSPAGQGVNLFSGLCPNQPDFDLALDSEDPNSVNGAPCGPLGNGETFAPQEDLNTINGEFSSGTWTLTIANADLNNSLTLESWALEISQALPYTQMDTTIENDPGECGAEFTWMHPFIIDNCGEGELVVEYTTEDSIDVPMGGEVEPGSEATEFFGVGTTTVTYTLTDKSGNTNMCSFQVTVLDVEIPVLVCPDDVTVNLGPGDCGSFENYLPEIIGDNCEVDTVIFDPPSGSQFEVGEHVITITVYDVSGNSATCTFTLIVNPYIPTSNTIACNDTVNVSLGPDCMYEIGADVILEGDDYGCYDDFCIEAVDENGDTIPGAILTLDHVGQYVTVTVTDCQGTGLSCWGVLNVEDKLLPVLTCPADVTIACNELTDTSFTGYPEVLSCELSVTITYDDDIVNNGECGDPRAVIERTWIATDESGNAGTCVQRIEVQAFDLSQVEFPDDLFGPTELRCEDVAANPELTEPDYAGWPTINGRPIFGNHLCEVNVGYWDEFLWDANCPGSYELLRNWVIRDECIPLEPGINPRRHIQSISVKDRVAPEINAWVDYNPDISSNSECTGIVYLGAQVEDNCSDLSETKWRATYMEGSATFIAGIGTLPQNAVALLPLGRTYTFVFTANDECFHFGTDTVVVDMTDGQAPIAICDEHTIVTLTNDNGGLDEGLTKIYAETFDDGSYDNCGPVTFLARRMDSCIDFDWIGPNGEYPNNDGGLPESIDRGLTFQPWVPFACCDVGNTIMVELRVTDAVGNISSCMVEVEVQDKLPPYIACMPDITVSCDFWFDAAETNGFVDQSEDVLTPVFGKVLDAYDYDPADREDIIIDDPGNTQLPQPYNWGLDGWADDNCDIELDVRVRLYNDCSGDELPSGAPLNAVRLVERTFRAQDNQGNTSTCRQRIWVVDFDPFTITDTQCGLNNSDDVRWPCDLTLTDCPQGELTPENLSGYAPNNKPQVNDDNCSLIGVTYDDQVFYFVDNACYKIIRTWTVIDWCQYDPVDLTGYWTYVQVIKVHDEEAPSFSPQCPDGPLTYCVADPEVTLPSNNQVFLGEGDPNSSACSAHMNLSHVVTEFCSDYVIYDVKLYPFNGSEFIQVKAKTTYPLDTLGNATIDWNSETSSLPANHPIRMYGVPYNDRYCSNWPLPGGEKDYHRILWTVEDGCGNIESCEYLFRLEDCKQPTPICVGLSSVVMPSSGSVTIWAKDFDSGSSVDDCTAHDDLLFSFSGDSYEPSREFDCDAIEVNGSPSFLVEIWAADEGNDQNCNGFVNPLGIEWGERNKDFCTTFIVIEDNEGICGDGAGGTVETEDLEAVESVTVNLTNPETQELMASFSTNDHGYFFFLNPLLGYEITASRNDDHKNGVSTLDLVRIQKHLLGIQLLDSPYKMIAADVNNSESVSALDLVEMRKLILGLYTEFPNNTSWRFVDSQFEFEDPTKPWPFGEMINVHGMTMGHDFVGVKVGDVNGSVVSNATQIFVRDSKGALEFVTDMKEVSEGQIVEVPISATNFNDILGYQLTLKTSGLVLTDVQPGALNLTAENIGIHPGAVTMSWSDAYPRTSVDVLFTLTFEANRSGNLHDMLRIVQHSGLTLAEAYSANEDLLDVELTFREGTAVFAEEFALFQNEPNPFFDGTTIGFTLPEALSGTMTFTDVTGRILKVIEGDFNAGYNEMYITRGDFSNAGIIYYQLQAGDFTASKKMVSVQ